MASLEIVLPNLDSFGKNFNVHIYDLLRRSKLDPAISLVTMNLFISGKNLENVSDIRFQGDVQNDFFQVTYTL